MRFPLVVLSVLAVSPAVATESIVGDWKPVGGSCSPTDGAISVGQLTLAQDEVVCSFDNVRRKGETVTWRGLCTVAGEHPVAATVVARHHKGVLSVVRNGRPDESTYVRCKG